jgi:hypothetical protein
VVGFIIKAILDYFYAKNLLLNLSKATVLISNENIIDSISFANQVGRLDLVSLLLAVFALVLGFGAVAGFMHIKDTSEGIAEREAKKWLDGEGIRTIEKWLNREEGIGVIETAIENYMKKKDSSGINTAIENYMKNKDSSGINPDKEKLKTENPQANFVELSDFPKKKNKQRGKK